LTPAGIFAAGIGRQCLGPQDLRRDFDRLAPAERDAALKAMDADKARIRGLQSKRYRGALQIRHGASSPIRPGGNRNKVLWRMVYIAGELRAAETYRARNSTSSQSIADCTNGGAIWRQ
jgi:hypothetical protein